MYKLKNIKTNEIHLCDKVTIDGFDYYVSDEKYAVGENCIGEDEGGLRIHKCVILNNCLAIGCKKVIATNNPNIDIPMVIDAVQVFAETKVPDGFRTIWKSGYNKSQKTHPFSLDDVKEIISLAREQYWDIDNRGFSSNTEGDWSFKYSTEDEIIQKYQETKVLTIFYE